MTTSIPSSLARGIPADATIAARIPSWLLLVAAAAIALATGPRGAVSALAWIAPVPYLVVARRIRTRRGWAGLAG